MKPNEQEAADAGVRVTIKLPKSLRHELIEWQHDRRIASLSEAARVLLRRALADDTGEKRKPR